MPTTADPDAQFQADLVALLPQMRAFSRSLTGDRAQADDLAQEAMLKAWRGRNGFQAGTNMKAWTFMIVRNQFLSDKRRSWRSQPLDPEVAERTLIAADNPGATMEVALAALREQHPSAIGVAVPVAPSETCDALRTLARQWPA